MTFPVLNALFDGAEDHFKEGLPPNIRNSVIDGHIIAIDLGEPMDKNCGQG